MLPVAPESCLPESCLPAFIVANFRTIRAKRIENKFLFGVFWCFLGILGDNKGQNLNIFLKVREGERLERWSVACLLACPLVAGGRGSGPACCLALVLWSCVPSFCPLSRSSLGALSLNVALFRILRAFLARFGAFVWVCIGSVLCVDCGAFVRVWS